MKKLSKIFKARVSPFLLVISGLAIITLLTAAGGILHYGSELNGNYEVAAAETLKKQKDDLAHTTQGADKKTQNGQSPSNGNSNPTYAGNAGAVSANTTQASSNGSGSSSSSKPVSYVKVFLSVNGNPKGGVTLKSTANQCDVLKQAYADHIISSLDMRYNSQYKSYGVYIIDGMGKPDTVQWRYTVNGKFPPLGCSYITVHKGDSINWKIN